MARKMRKNPTQSVDDLSAVERAKKLRERRKEQERLLKEAGLTTGSGKKKKNG